MSPRTIFFACIWRVRSVSKLDILSSLFGEIREILLPEVFHVTALMKGVSNLLISVQHDRFSCTQPKRMWKQEKNSWRKFWGKVYRLWSILESQTSSFMENLSTQIEANSFEIKLKKNCAQPREIWNASFWKSTANKFSSQDVWIIIRVLLQSIR